MTETQATAETAGFLCEAEGVGHTFRTPARRPVRVLDGIELQIRPNEVVALLGPSGCGKSTLLRILAGLIRPTEGEVRVHGRPLRGINPGVAIVFQSFALYPWMTAAENVRTVLRAREWSACGSLRQASTSSTFTPAAQRSSSRYTSDSETSVDVSPSRASAGQK